MGGTTLQRHMLHTNAVDRAREEIGRVFCPHRLQPGPAGVDVRFNAHRSGGVAVVGLDYGHRVQITPGRLESFYLVMVPLAGRAMIDHGSDHFVSTPATAAVLSPTEQVDMVWGEGNPQLLCWLDRDAVQQELMLLAEGEVDGPLRFRAELRVDDPGARSWLGAVRRLWQQLTDPQPQQPGRWERTVLTTLLLSQPHNHSDLVSRCAGSAATVRRATTWMELRISEPLSLPQVAAGVGVGVRQLQKSFRAELGEPPAAWLKQRRLRLARERLEQAAPEDTTVTTVAGELAINHLGRFSAEYRNAFGESPSQTLSRPAC